MSEGVLATGFEPAPPPNSGAKAKTLATTLSCLSGYRYLAGQNDKQQMAGAPSMPQYTSAGGSTTSAGWDYFSPPTSIDLLTVFQTASTVNSFIPVVALIHQFPAPRAPHLGRRGKVRDDNEQLGLKLADEKSSLTGMCTRYGSPRYNLRTSNMAALTGN